MKMEKRFSRNCAATTVVLVSCFFGAAGAQQSPAPADASTPRSVFDVASIKPSDPSVESGLYNVSAPGDLNVTGITVKALIMQSYHLLRFQVTGEPEWVDSERYDISAKVLDDSADENVKRLLQGPKAMSRNGARFALEPQRIQALLADRFKLVTHRSTKEMPIYALVVNKDGSKLHAHEATPYRIAKGVIKGQGVPISVLISQLSYELDHILVDKTGLTGFYDIDLKWTPDDAPAGESSAPSLRTALKEQLGLKIESQRGPVEVLVVDQVERPTPN